MSASSRPLVAARGLDGTIRSGLPRRDFSGLPTVQLAFIARHSRGMPADWIEDATAELERRAQEAREYCGDNRPHAGEAMRLPTGWRFFGGEGVA